MIKEMTLPDLSREFTDALKAYGYSNDSLSRYSRVLDELSRFAGSACYSQRLGGKFLAEKLGNFGGLVTCGEHSKTEMYYLRTVRMLNKYCCFGTLFREETCLGPIIWPDAFKDAIYGFFEEKTAYACTEATLRHYEITIRDLLLHLDASDIHNPQSITPTHVSGFISSLVGYAPKTVAGRISNLREFFKYMYLAGYTQISLVQALPKTCGYARTKLPTIWTPNEVESILGSVDLGNPNGRRDYAMLLLMARLGLRVGDVKNLRLTDIDWESGLITIIQGKTDRKLTLPLPDDVGWAIIQYLKNGRPDTPCSNVFVRHSPPFDAFSEYTKFYGKIARLITKTDIPPEKQKRAGAHSLRHSLATNLLRSQVEPSTISSILGHTDPKTAKHYFRVDIMDLRHCALDVEVTEIG